VRNAVGALRGGEPARALLGASALGLCANALVHSPLVFHPASAALGAALLGSLTPLGARARPSAGLLLFPALAASFLGLPVITHGRALAAALAARASAAATAEGGRAITPEVAAGVRVHLERALGALGDSTPALLRRAEWARTEGEPALPFYEQVLARRPYDLEALQQSALLALVEQRDVERARAAWQAVLRLDPAHPRVLRNLIELELDFGTPAAALAHAQALRSSGCLEAPWVDATAARLLLAGRSEPGLAMLAFHDERFAVRSGQALLALSKELQSTPRAELASALNSAAHHAWALEHIAQENPKNAVRSYRQAMRPTYAHHPGGAPRLCVELAAALALAGDAPAAESELAALGDQAAEHVSAAPDWARNALAELLQRSR
jgi:tetratricopeptide (TPR) repeat protein